MSDGAGESEVFPTLAGEGSPDDSADDGLELDERQSEEMRRIFGTTLPQYIVPLEEMIEQGLSGPRNAEGLRALAGTIDSLSQAAARMSFGDVCRVLDSLAATTSRLEVGTAGVPLEVREALLGDLLELKDLAEQMSGAETADDRPSPPTAITILRAVGDAEWLDRDAVGRLTAAGVVTVDQLLAARPDEVAVVSGVELATVRELQRRLAGGPAGKVIDLPVDDQALQTIAEEKLRRELALATETQAQRAEVRRLRLHLQQRREELRRAQDDRDRLRVGLEQAAAELAKRAEVLDQTQAELAAAARRCAALEESLLGDKTAVARLRVKRQELLERDGVVGQELEALVERVERLRRRVSRVETGGRRCR